MSIAHDIIWLYRESLTSYTLINFFIEIPSENIQLRNFQTAIIRTLKINKVKAITFENTFVNNSVNNDIINYRFIGTNISYYKDVRFT